MRFAIVHDADQPCPYREGFTARLPLRLPLAEVTPHEFDTLLDEGDRRYGPLVYRTDCEACAACEPIRIPVDQFVPSRSQRRAWRRNHETVQMEIGTPCVTDERVALFNRHKNERGLAVAEDTVTEANAYRLFLVETCVDSLEIRYRVAGRLVALSILDVGETSASSVYHYFDPDEAWRSLGVYSVLAEIDWCRRHGLAWYYLGYFVRDCARLSYKAEYLPHQRRQHGQWVEFVDREA